MNTIKKLILEQLNEVAREKNINEIGDASLKSYFVSEVKKGVYRFLTQSGAEMGVEILQSANGKRIVVSFGIIENYDDDSVNFSYAATGASEQYRIMSTVVDVVKNHMKNLGTVNSIVFYATDTRRLNFYMAYLKKFFGDDVKYEVVGTMVYVETKDGEPFDLNNLNENKINTINEIGDASAEAYPVSEVEKGVYYFITESGVDMGIEIDEWSGGRNIGVSFGTAFFDSDGNMDIDFEFEGTDAPFKVISTVLGTVEKYLKNSGMVETIFFHIINPRIANFYKKYLDKYLGDVKIRQVPNGGFEIKTQDGSPFYANSLNENKMEKINEIGDASAEAYPVTELVPQFYYFLTDSGTEMGVEINTANNGKFISISFGVLGHDEYDEDYPIRLEFLSTGLGEQYKILATVVTAIKKYLKKNNKVNAINFYATDRKRANFYISYFRKFLGTGDNVEYNIEGNDVSVKTIDGSPFNLSEINENHLVNKVLSRIVSGDASPIEQNENKINTINEIGDASAYTYPVSLIEPNFYYFLTDSGLEMGIRIDTYWDNKYITVSFGIITSKDSDTIYLSYPTTNASEQYKILATVVGVIKKRLKEIGTVTTISLNATDNKRLKFYMNYLKKSFGDSVEYEISGNSLDAYTKDGKPFDLKHLNENKINTINEIGDASADTYPASLLKPNFYYFLTDSGLEMGVKIETIFNRSMVVSFGVVNVDTDDEIKMSYRSTNASEQYKILATVVDIIKKQLKKIGTIQRIAFSATDTRRLNFYMSYLKKFLGNNIEYDINGNSLSAYTKNGEPINVNTLNENILINKVLSRILKR